MSLLRLLGNNGFISYNKDVARNIGVYEAIVLGELCSIADFYNYSEFYFSQEKIENDTGLSVRQIRKAIETLVNYNFVTVTKKGQPCKNWYFLNEDAILNYLKQFSEKSQMCKNETSSCTETEQLEVQNLPNKKCKKCTASCAETTPLLINNNTEVIIQSNNTNISDNEVVRKKRKTQNTENQERKDKVQSFLNTISESDLETYKQCVKRIVDFRKEKDSHFGISHKQLDDWIFNLALFAEKNQRSSTEIFETLSFGLSDSFWSVILFDTKIFTKHYEKIFAKSKSINRRIDNDSQIGEINF